MDGHLDHQGKRIFALHRATLLRPRGRTALDPRDALILHGWFSRSIGVAAERACPRISREVTPALAHPQGMPSSLNEQTAGCVVLGAARRDLIAICAVLQTRHSFGRCRRCKNSSNRMRYVHVRRALRAEYMGKTWVMARAGSVMRGRASDCDTIRLSGYSTETNRRYHDNWTPWKSYPPTQLPLEAVCVVLGIPNTVCQITHADSAARVSRKLKDYGNMQRDTTSAAIAEMTH